MIANREPVVSHCSASMDPGTVLSSLCRRPRVPRSCFTRADLCPRHDALLDLADLKGEFSIASESGNDWVVGTITEAKRTGDSSRNPSDTALMAGDMLQITYWYRTSSTGTKTRTINGVQVDQVDGRLALDEKKVLTGLCEQHTERRTSWRNFVISCPGNRGDQESGLDRLHSDGNVRLPMKSVVVSVGVGPSGVLLAGGLRTRPRAYLFEWVRVSTRLEVGLIVARGLHRRDCGS